MMKCEMCELPPESAAHLGFMGVYSEFTAFKHCCSLSLHFHSVPFTHSMHLFIEKKALKIHFRIPDQQWIAENFSSWLDRYFPQERPKTELKQSHYFH